MMQRTNRNMDTEESVSERVSEQLPLKSMMIILLVLFIMAVLIWGYNFTRLRTIEAEGLTRYTADEFKNMTADRFYLNNTIVYYIKNSLFPTTDLPFIESYEVSYVDGHTVHVLVHEKMVTGCVQIMGRYLYFDKDGIVVESTKERMERIPLITGLEFDEIVLNKPLQVQKKSLFSTILQLTRLLQEYSIDADRVSFDSNYLVTLYCGEIKVLLGKRDMYDEQISALQGILNVAGGRTGTLDMQNYSRENPEVILN